MEHDLKVNSGKPSLSSCETCSLSWHIFSENLPSSIHFICSGSVRNSLVHKQNLKVPIKLFGLSQQIIWKSKVFNLWRKHSNIKCWQRISEEHILKANSGALYESSWAIFHSWCQGFFFFISILLSYELGSLEWYIVATDVTYLLCIYSWQSMAIY